MAWLSKLRRPISRWVACVACLLNIIHFASSADVYVKNDCSENVSVGVAFVTDDTDKCDYLDEGADPPLCVNYWVGASGGELAGPIVSGLSNTCIYLTAYMNDDITYTWGAGNCDSCTFDLEHRACTPGAPDCYSWTKIGDSGQCEALTEDYTWTISCGNHTPPPSEPTPNNPPTSSPTPSPKPPSSTPSPTPSPSPKPPARVDRSPDAPPIAVPVVPSPTNSPIIPPDPPSPSPSPSRTNNNPSTNYSPIFNPSSPTLPPFLTPELGNRAPPTPGVALSPIAGAPGPGGIVTTPNGTVIVLPPTGEGGQAPAPGQSTTNLDGSATTTTGDGLTDASGNPIDDGSSGDDTSTDTNTNDSQVQGSTTQSSETSTVSVVAMVLGAVVGGTVILAVIAAAAIYIIRKKRQNKKDIEAANTASPTGSMQNWPLINGNGAAIAVRPSNGGVSDGSFTTGGSPSSQAQMLRQTMSMPAGAQNYNSVTARDPLLLYLSQRTASGRRSSGLGSPLSPARSSGGVDVRNWEFYWDQLEILKPIGEGSFGKVYAARWNETVVAVKVLIKTGDDPEAAMSLSSPLLSTLCKEATLLASLRHPNTVSFLGVCASPPAIATEYCARGSLMNVLRNGKSNAEEAAQLTWTRRLGIAIDAAKGMLYLHAHAPPIIHRDLKSPNLLVDEHWRSKVSDFNLSRLMEDTSSSSSLDAMNPRWVAPEVLAGARAGAENDVFAFGVVLWELLTWDLPWGATPTWTVVTSVIAGGRPEIPDKKNLPGPASGSWTGLDEYLKLMQRCWAQEPSDRPVFSEIVQLLRALLEQSGGSEHFSPVNSSLGAYSNSTNEPNSFSVPTVDPTATQSIPTMSYQQSL